MMMKLMESPTQIKRLNKIMKGRIITCGVVSYYYENLKGYYSLHANKGDKYTTPYLYLKFNITITNGTANNAFRWGSAGSHSCIQRVRCFHGSNLISDVDNYGMLANMLFDLQMPSDAVAGKYNLLCGCRADTVAKTINAFPAVVVTAIGTADASTAAATAGSANAVLAAQTASINTALATASSTNISANLVNSGERIGGDGALNGAGAVASQTYCLSLISLVGVLCSQNYIPLFEMTSAPLRIEIQLVDQLVKACNVLTVATAISTATLTNVEYTALSLSWVIQQLQ
jgi:hypothetical protein